jgi:hypothetical protein
MAKAKAAKEASEAASGIAGEGAVLQPKKSLWERFKNEMIHYWHGTKLLGKEIKISSKLAARLLNGNKLTRREQRQASSPSLSATQHAHTMFVRPSLTHLTPPRLPLPGLNTT